MACIQLDGATARYLLKLMTKGVENNLFTPTHFLPAVEEFLAQLPHDEEQIITSLNEVIIYIDVDITDLLLLVFHYGDLYAIDEGNNPVGVKLYLAVSRLITKED